MSSTALKTLGASLRAGIVVVFDLEYTAWEGTWQRHWTGPKEHREIVQIGAVKVDTASGYLERARLARLVRPLLNPTLSPYFTNLTGIRQEELDWAGVGFAEALAEFAAFTCDSDAIVSWGGDEMTLAENCGLNRVSCPIEHLKFHNVRSMVCEGLGIPYNTPSGNLPEVLGLPAVGTKHDALSDACAIVAALRHMMAARRQSTESDRL